jgi:UMF1 family MFS transporter
MRGHQGRTENTMALFDTEALNPGVTRREVLAWACYDFANSGYTTVVLTAVFSAYFVGTVAADVAHPTTVWTWVLAVSNALVMVAMPLIGAYADLRARKKWLLVWSTAGCVVTTALLALAGRGDLVLASAAIIASNFFFMIGVALIAAFLPELARPEGLGRVSGWGWSFGYLGGMGALGICIGYVMWSRGHGLGAEHYVPVTMLIVAVTFALAAWPTLALLRERAQPQTESVAGHVRESWVRLWQTLRQARTYRDFAMLLACGALYQAGVTVVIALAAIYAQEVMHFDTLQTMTLIFAVNITAALGAFLFGYVQDWLGHRRTLALTLIGWLAMTWIAAASTSVGMFWLAANLAGICMGSSQSAGRAMAGALAPEKRRAEFYGLWILATQLASVIGPLTYGAVIIATGNDHRVSILVTGVFFLAGLLLIAPIDMRRGRQVAEASS